MQRLNNVIMAHGRKERLNFGLSDNDEENLFLLRKSSSKNKKFEAKNAFWENLGAN